MSENIVKPPNLRTSWEVAVANQLWRQHAEFTIALNEFVTENDPRLSVIFKGESNERE